MNPEIVDRVDGARIARAARIVDDAGVVAMLDGWRDDDGRGVGGRRRFISDRSMLTLMVVLALEGKPLHVTAARDIICRRATDGALDRLGLPDRGSDDYTSRLGQQRWYDRAWNAIHRILAPIDLYPEVRYRHRYDKETWATLVAGRDPELVALRRERLTRLSNALVMASTKRMPTDIREKWEGDVVVDATPIPAVRLGTSKRSSRVSSEPDAGWYVRRGDHDGGDGTDGTVLWAYEATLVAAMMPDGAPHPIIGISLDRPGHQPHARARDALAHITADPSMPRGNLVGDMLYYPNGEATTWQIPMRQAGYTLVGDLPVDRRGITARYAGAVQVGGSWYCPAMPHHLVNAGDDHRAGLIDDAELDERIVARTAFALRVKERTRDGGAKYMCPARGSGATVSCPLVKGARNVAGRTVKIFDSQVPAPDKRGRCCTNASSVTIPVTAGAKFAQQGPAWGTPEWKSAYQPPRATIESRNAILKTGAGGGLGDTTRRMIRGFTAAAMFVALGVVAVNVTLIARFLARGATPGGAPVPPSPSTGRGRPLDHDAAANAPPLAA
ncbi:hypothetical protein [Corynebacterium nuruki]|uniref:hypothetical protein n=1 Tax=Corynebacterium nuruki TaxID=1032851 RepID=UPI0039BF5ED7